MPDSHPLGLSVCRDRWTVWRVRMGSFAGEWRATKQPHTPEALGVGPVEQIEVVPAAEHEALRCATRDLVKLAEEYADEIMRITGSVDGFLWIEAAKEAIGDD